MACLAVQLLNVSLLLEQITRHSTEAHLHRVLEALQESDPSPTPDCIHVESSRAANEGQLLYVILLKHLSQSANPFHDTGSHLTIL